MKVSVFKALQHLVLSFYDSYHTWYDVVSHCDLICISMVTSRVGHLFICVCHLRIPFCCCRGGGGSGGVHASVCAFSHMWQYVCERWWGKVALRCLAQSGLCLLRQCLLLNPKLTHSTIHPGDPRPASQVLEL